MDRGVGLVYHVNDSRLAIANKDESDWIQFSTPSIGGGIKREPYGLKCTSEAPNEQKFDYDYPARKER